MIEGYYFGSICEDYSLRLNCPMLNDPKPLSLLSKDVRRLKFEAGKQVLIAFDSMLSVVFRSGEAYTNFRQDRCSVMVFDGNLKFLV